MGVLEGVMNARDLKHNVEYTPRAHDHDPPSYNLIE